MRIKRTLPLLLALLLTLLAGCSPSPEALRVGKNKVDASELAFYLNFNMQELESRHGFSGGSLYGEEHLEEAKALALEQITAAEIVRLKCKELQLELTKEERALLKEEKEAFIDSLGGKAKYLAYLNENFLTDRLYDKVRESTLLSDLLFAYVTGELSAESFDDQSLRAFFDENYTRVKHIRFSLLDPDGAAFDQASIETLREQARVVLEQAQAGEDFDELIATYNDDERMDHNPDGVVKSRMEAEEQFYLSDLFSLSLGECGGVYTDFDGFYIIKRYDVEPSYFAKNKDAILQNAVEQSFVSGMAQWTAETPVTKTAVWDKMNFENMEDYVK